MQVTRNRCSTLFCQLLRGNWKKSKASLLFPFRLFLMDSEALALPIVSVRKSLQAWVASHPTTFLFGPRSDIAFLYTQRSSATTSMHTPYRTMNFLVFVGGLQTDSGKFLT
ncbi:hypothetical protein I7I48_00582 [Histoplasma ohiense]|nr:hypothetical protein I7I48_00582 [Histoplasma ohiense (nom. inval.)]